MQKLLLLCVFSFCLFFVAQNAGVVNAASIIKKPIEDTLSWRDEALLWAIKHESFVLAKLFINAGADINKQDKDGHTPLMYAAGLGYDRIVRLLLASGAKASINKQDKKGNTALIYASVHGFMYMSAAYRHDAAMRHVAIVALLLEEGAKVNMQDDYGYTALMLILNSTKGGFGNQYVKEVVHLLIQAQADVNIQDRVGRTALMSAVKFGDVSIVRLLLENGAKVDIQDNSGKTALDYVEVRATYKKVKDTMIQLLREAEANK